MVSNFAADSAAAARAEFDVGGEGLVWAVLGPGVDGSHPHFRIHANLELPPGLDHVDFTSPELTPAIRAKETLTDLHGMGTHSAALIAGESREPPALATAARICKIVSLKVVSDDGKTGGERQVAMALEHLIEVNRERLRIHGVVIPLGWHDNFRLYPG